MKLDEAKQILKKAGYLVRSLNEDTETNDDEYNSVMDELDAAWERDYSRPNALAKRRNDLEDRHIDLDDKIRSAKKFNAPDIDSYNISTMEDIIDWAEYNGWEAGWTKDSPLPCVHIEFNDSDENWARLVKDGKAYFVECPSWGNEFRTLKKAAKAILDFYITDVN